MTSFPHGNQYTAPHARRWTAPRRYALINELAARQTTLEAIEATHGISAPEISLWLASMRRNGLEGLKAKRLTALARQQRERASPAKPYGAAKAARMLRSVVGVA